MLIRARIASDMAASDDCVGIELAALGSLLISAMTSSSSSLVGLNNSVLVSTSGCLVFVGKTPVGRVPGRDRLFPILRRKERTDGSAFSSFKLEGGSGGGGGALVGTFLRGSGGIGIFPMEDVFFGGKGMLLSTSVTLFLSPSPTALAKKH